MNLWATLAGAFVGTLVLTTALRGASELRLTRMDLPFLLGTMVTTNRSRAKAIGYTAHFVSGQAFGLVYGAIFAALGHGGTVLGALLGLLHGVFASSAIVNVLLPAMHPRMGTLSTSAPAVAMLEPPGFLMLNYGIGTPIVNVLAHTAYGAIIGAFIGIAG